MGGDELASTIGWPPFYTRLNAVLKEADFDRFAEEQCEPYYAAGQGRPSIPPGTYFRKPCRRIRCTAVTAAPPGRVVLGSTGSGQNGGAPAGIERNDDPTSAVCEIDAFPPATRQTFAERSTESVEIRPPTSPVSA